jgi:serine protease Do
MYGGIVKLLCACTLFTLTIGCTTTVSRTESDTPPLLSAKEVYDRISPSLAFVYTPLGSGSGALMDDGYILTNAHVVWPYSQVGVTFAGGTALQEVPVAFIDLIGDLALLGPVDIDAAAVTLVPRENLEIGSDVYLIGYPVETEAFPKPTITRGILSRIREWTRIEFTFFQTDAAIAGGQSGGVLATDRGEVIGI